MRRDACCNDARAGREAGDRPSEGSSLMINGSDPLSMNLYNALNFDIKMTFEN